MSIDVSVKAFEGPLDLLLSLIKEKQIDIYTYLSQRLQQHT